MYVLGLPLLQMPPAHRHLGDPAQAARYLRVLEMNLARCSLCALFPLHVVGHAWSRTISVSTTPVMLLTTHLSRPRSAGNV